ncbi:hypothetical protein [Reinekea marinisedimentorum]|uniref:Porin-like protein n=1 Tax=Reinekea marinisedimentorum TaxID=230495 RepID=A0A4R3I492_9GAMM|nr:hypothetical protein [Reinekea marinisedimentorum]TCS40696.1 hypothetical protein BCF53_10852 [Reinekea marinisedimentorum]
MFFGRSFPRAAAVLLTLNTSFLPLAHAIDLGSDQLRLHGFGSLAVTHSGDGEIYFPYYLTKEEMDEAGTYFDESLLGLQLDATLTDSLEATSQVIVRNRKDDSLENSLERVSIKYANGGFLARVGRIGMNIYTLSEYRDVGFAYTWAHPSMEFYGQFGMDYFDGAEVAYSFQLPAGTLQASVYGGQATQEFGGSTELDYTDLLGSTLIWSHNSWVIRGGWFRGTIDGDLQSFANIRAGLQSAVEFSDSYSVETWAEAEALIDDFEIDGTDINYTSLGVTYDAYPWLIESELSYTDLEAEALSGFFSGYISTGYSFDVITLFAMAGFIEPAEERKVVSDVETLSGPYASYQEELEALQQGVQSAYNNRVDQNSLSIGMRVDVRQNMAIKLQWDHTWIDEYGNGLWYRDKENEDKTEVDTLSLKLDFVF